MSQLGLKPRLAATTKPPATMSDGAAGLSTILSQWPDSDLVICVSDPLAFGVIMTCRTRGIAVPSMLAVAGFGDFEVARISDPSITTVSIDAQQIGRCTAQAVLSAVLQPQPPKKSRRSAVIPFRITMRESA
ncbi:substrate-binding domain-containing protein [Bradyrhizobium septentrionale]|nr:substrate-binding domain-containing protein [Bradyrhizobium septentrionale]UGY29485.1 substrate-binding domain-containing protein [Bradyrhizobium septentrionale]